MPDRHSTSLVAITRLNRGGKPEQMGSGVLITLFGQHFLLSATHVLAEANIALPGLPLNEAGRIFLTKPSDGTPHDDHLDIGYVLLNEHAVSHLTRIGRTFLPANTIPIEVEGFMHVVYVFSSFPASHSTTRMKPVTVESTPTFIKGDALSQQQLFRLNRDPKLHIGITYRREKQVDEDSGARITGPMPYGMSGGPVWLILPNDTPALVAIGTDYLNDALIGTLIQPMIAYLKRKYDSAP